MKYFLPLVIMVFFLGSANIAFAHTQKCHLEFKRCQLRCLNQGNLYYQNCEKACWTSLNACISMSPDTYHAGNTDVYIGE